MLDWLNDAWDSLDLLDVGATVLTGGLYSGATADAVTSHATGGAQTNASDYALETVTTSASEAADKVTTAASAAVDKVTEAAGEIGAQLKTAAKWGTVALVAVAVVVVVGAAIIYLPKPR